MDAQQHQDQQPPHHHYTSTSTSMGDLRHFTNTSSTTHFPSFSLQRLFPGHNININMDIFGRPHQLHPPALHHFASLSDSAPLNTPTPALSSGLETEGDTSAACFPGDASTGRWPRQETLTLLDIRSRLHPKFKLANQKGPLWDELSRIMCEEFGYQRSGKKCREKFENLYKYYKKTKEGKAGRQDGKHYRFFRQLEALCGDDQNTISNPSSSAPEPNFGTTTLPHFQHSHHQTNQEIMFSHDHSVMSLTNSTELDTSSSEENNDDSRGKRRVREKIKELIDSQMKEVMEKQEAWVERLMKTLEEKEKERVMREEEWSRQEAARLEREHKFWAKERAWIEARDAALMDALQKLTGINTGHQVVKAPPQLHMINVNPEEADHHQMLHESWADSEITTLLQMRAEVESSSSEEALWEEVATKMACFGYQKTASMCKQKWENITNYYTKELGSKKRKDNSTRCFYFHHNNDNNDQSSVYNNQGSSGYASSPPSNSNVANNADTCFPLFMCDTENVWQNYGFKLNKGNQNP